MAGLVFLVFAVHFIRMGLRIRNPGALYSYIGNSMGTRMGADAATLATMAYPGSTGDLVVSFEGGISS